MLNPKTRKGPPEFQGRVITGNKTPLPGNTDTVVRILVKKTFSKKGKCLINGIAQIEATCLLTPPASSIY